MISTYVGSPSSSHHLEWEMPEQWQERSPYVWYISFVILERSLRDIVASRSVKIINNTGRTVVSAWTRGAQNYMLPVCLQTDYGVSTWESKKRRLRSGPQPEWWNIRIYCSREVGPLFWCWSTGCVCIDMSRLLYFALSTQITIILSVNKEAINLIWKRKWTSIFLYFCH